jgi:hypothetical protein
MAHLETLDIIGKIYSERSNLSKITDSLPVSLKNLILRHCKELEEVMLPPSAPLSPLFVPISMRHTTADSWSL